MSELKVINAYLPTFDADHNEMILVSHTKENYVPAKQMEFYLKSEADKVIAEKDKEIAEQDKAIAELKEQVHDYALGSYVMQARSEKQLRHSNYKRCLAMARWCDEVMLSCELRGYTVHRIWANKHKWAMRWKYRWLELAEKFKEAK